ncbi:MAG: hypothetical protein PUF48_03185 [Oscillospiraceae bacterium]|nr:hypothetical protein [Oscillospiraceae bacterium]
MAIKLSTGKIAFPIEFDNGDKQNIYFNPNDPDLATRLMAAKDKISKRLESMQFEDFKLSNSGEPVEIENLDDFINLTDEQVKALTEKAEKTAKIVTETKNIIYEELNTAFDSDVSSVVFKHCSPFAVVNGEYFIMQFLSAITPEIQKAVNKSNAEVEKNMAKHIAKYSK